MTKVDPASQRNETATIQYGPDRDQWFEFWPPNGERQHLGTIALIHGGFWRESLTAELMDPLAADLASRGWTVANIEYRRGANGPWPAPAKDVSAALRSVATYKGREGWTGPLVSIGHSVGGQLALLSTSSVDYVVALAPVTDLGRTWLEGLGEDAAQEYFGSGPDVLPASYRSGSPLNHLPPRCPVLLVHGSADQRIPVEHSIAYAQAVGLSGVPIQFLTPESTDHFNVIDPSWDEWDSVVQFVGTFSRPKDSEDS
ncbi:alpha/beta hydrolase [Paeniglutamicibacter psychrophenolicus]|uniref:Acetyl esterase/lipase n=1 Tax=Paeniglutamicibacter psychrophenolicus TaxID=257454 RepID=A0ABS4WJM5_9MICC|nr:acetyl esterase/lipase [Paeniglutamicibacter psychrophenolicus]